MGFDLQNACCNIKFWKTQRKFENSKLKIANLKKTAREYLKNQASVRPLLSLCEDYF